MYSIQTVKEEVRHDFSFFLMESVRYQKWLKPKMNENMKWEFHQNFHTVPFGNVPVGSIEFVTGHLREHYDLTPKPLNVPFELKDFAGRDVFDVSGKYVGLSPGKYYVKSKEKLKSKLNGPINRDLSYTEDYYQVSEIIEIDSEWRFFVFEGELVGSGWYSGDFLKYPDSNTVKEMIKYFTKQPVAWTLDVGVKSNGDTVIIEAHDFFSCGLYGFSDPRILPQMFSRWFFEYVKNNRVR